MKLALLLRRADDTAFVVGPFATREARDRWEERNPQHADDISGQIEIYGPAEPFPGRRY